MNFGYSDILIPSSLQNKKEKLHVTNIEQAAWKLSDTLAKTIEYLHKTDLNETTRRKMIRDILKDNFVNFYTQLRMDEETKKVL
jgi:hypothetical protein